MGAGGALRGAHFYPKVPRELTEGTSLGGALSLLGIAAAVCLSYIHTASYLRPAVQTKLVLDAQEEPLLVLSLNVTLERLPCRFTSVDLFDETGSKRLNISDKNLIKLRVSGADGHVLGADDAEIWTDERTGEVDAWHVTGGEAETEAKELSPDDAAFVNTLDARGFDAAVSSKQLVLVAFGAPWCPWSQRLQPAWRETAAKVHSEGYGELVRAPARENGPRCERSCA
jgi:hypothetical protein